MDSGNSGSMQSSSGGDEEHDSRAEESISALLNFSAQRTMLNSSQPPHHPPMFDSISTYLDNFSRSPPPPPSNMNSLLNLDMGWARAPRSDDPNCTNMAGAFRSSSSTSGLQPSNLNNPCYMNPINPSSGSENGRASSSADQQNVVRSSKKRSRASRRAPTTVLTTDTTNFRAMVQEFTGIPAPPFSGSSFPRNRLDLFSSGSTLRSGLSDPSPPPYLLRPFVQKAPQTRPSFISFPLSSSSSNSSLAAASSTMLNAAVSSSPNATNSTIMRSSIDTPNLASTNIYRLPSYDLGLPKHQRNLLNMQNPMSNFQSLLQSPPPPPTTKYPSAGLSGFGGKSQEPMDRMGTLEGFSMNQGGVNVHHHHHGGGTLANLISTDDPPNWGDGGGSSGGDEGGHLRPFDGNYSSSQRVSSCCKVNYTASSSDFHAEKGSENVASRGEGMVDSWICSSD